MSADFAVGDLVEAEKKEIASSTRFRGLVVMPVGGTRREHWQLEAPELTPNIEWLERNGFTLTVIEKALPPLPTVPGTVIRFKGNFGVWQLYKSGLWQNSVEGNLNGLPGDALVEVYGSDFDVLGVSL